MNLSPEFVDAVEKNDLLSIRIMIKDSMVFDPTLHEYFKLLEYAEKKISDLYDEDNGAKYETDKSNWDKDYMNHQLVEVIDNFSRERLYHLTEVCQQVYKKRIEVIENPPPEVVKFKKQVGMGLTAVGVIIAATGIVIFKPMVIGIGVAAAIAGGVMLFYKER